MDRHETDIVPVHQLPLKLNKKVGMTAIIRADASGYVPHLGLPQVMAIAEAAGSHGRHRERDRLLVQTLFDGCLRVSEALRLMPRSIAQDSGGWRLEVFGKGGRPGVVAISPSLAAQLQAYAYRTSLEPEGRFFSISRTRAFQIIDGAMNRAGVVKPDHAGACHVLRHSGALARLKITGNPRAIQDQLRHSTARMTLRYFQTLQAEESLKIQQEVNFEWK